MSSDDQFTDVRMLIKHQHSNLIARSIEIIYQVYLSDKLNARMVELVDTPDLKSCALWGVRVQVPLRVQNQSENESESEDSCSDFSSLSLSHSF